MCMLELYHIECKYIIQTEQKRLEIELQMETAVVKSMWTAKLHTHMLAHHWSVTISNHWNYEI